MYREKMLVKNLSSACHAEADDRPCGLVQLTPHKPYPLPSIDFVYDRNLSNIIAGKGNLPTDHIHSSVEASAAVSADSEQPDSNRYSGADPPSVLH